MSSNSTKPLIIRPSHIKEITGLSKTTIWRLEQAGNFPKRRKIGEGCVGWIYTEVEECLNRCEKIA